MKSDDPESTASKNDVITSTKGSSSNSDVPKTFCYPFTIQASPIRQNSPQNVIPTEENHISDKADSNIRKLNLKTEISALRQVLDSLQKHVQSKNPITKGELLKIKYEISLSMSNRTTYNLIDIIDKYTNQIYQNNILKNEIKWLNEQINAENNFRKDLSIQYDLADDAISIDTIPWTLHQSQIMSEFDILPSKNMDSLKSQLNSLHSQILFAQKSDKIDKNLTSNAGIEAIVAEDMKFQTSLKPTIPLLSEIERLQNEIVLIEKSIANSIKENASISSNLQKIKDSSNLNENILSQKFQESEENKRNEIQHLLKQSMDIRTQLQEGSFKISSITSEIKQIQLTISRENDISFLDKNNQEIKQNFLNLFNSELKSSRGIESEYDWLNEEEISLNSQREFLKKQIQRMKIDYKTRKNNFLNLQNQKKKEISILFKKLKMNELRIQSHK